MAVIDRGEKARDEFLSESQEIAEQLNRDLLALASTEKDAEGRPVSSDPELLNDAFRAVHSLKGLAGLFGVSRMLHMSHQLENLLDALRLSKVTLTPAILDLLFEAVELYQQLIAEIGQTGHLDVQGAGVDEFVSRIDRALNKPTTEVPKVEEPWGGFELDPMLLAVLTEYEEHRLRENIREGRGLYRIMASFPLGTIDVDLETLKGRLKPVGEVITYLPGASSGDPDRIDLEVMLGSSRTQIEVAQVVSDLQIEVIPVPRRGPQPPPGRTTSPRSQDGETQDGSGPKGSPSRQRGSGSPSEDLSSGTDLEGATERPRFSRPPESRGARGTDTPVMGTRATGTRDERGLKDPSAGKEPDPKEDKGSRGEPGRPSASRVGSHPPDEPTARRKRDSSSPEDPREHAREVGPSEGAPQETSLKSVAQTVRVDIRKLDHLMNIVGELALARTGIQVIQNELKRNRGQTELARGLQDELRVLSRKIDELQAGILEVRMVPLGQVFDKLSRVVRKLSREAGKEIRFVVSGADTELDKLIVEELSDPLMHVIRNAIDHGIERSLDRSRVGKPEVGTVAISAEQRGNHVVLEVEDDGAGIDSQALVNRAIMRGLVTEDQSRELTQHEIYNLVFLPGISTRDVADEISGRGVGMDVVKTNIARLSGIIDLASEPGRGTRLTITLPITLAIIQALVIRSAGRTYAIPLNSVMESLMLDYGHIRTIERREVITLRDQTLPLLRLDEVFHLRRAPGVQPPHRGYVVVVALAQHRLGLLVDDLIGQQDIVIKSLGRSLQGIPGIAGATELGGQQTALVLDVRALAEEALPRAVEAA